MASPPNSRLMGEAVADEMGIFRVIEMADLNS